MQISKRFYFVIILHLILEKVTKYLVKSSLPQKLSTKNLMVGGKQPPSAFRVKVIGIRPMAPMLNTGPFEGI